MGRYTLKVKLNNQIITVNLADNGILREKVSLMTIDSYTIGNHPKYILKELGFSEANLKGNEKFYISYLSQGKEKKLNVLFNDTHNIKDLSDKNERIIKPNNPILVEFINNTFLPLAVEKNFREFLKKHNLITAKLEQWVEDYLNGSIDLKFCYSKILEHSANYKQFRGLVVGAEVYKNHDFLIPKEVLNEEIKEVHNQRDTSLYRRFILPDLEKDIDPDASFALYSEEELRRYSEYLDSLPDEFHPHDKSL